MKKEMNYRFKFSIVMAAYNVAAYLEDAIESILQQDINFSESVQLIIVNDGSTDQSGEICDKYSSQYPNNIKVIHKENGGVSSARNEGLKHVEGRYINFMDADDMFSPNTLSDVYEYFHEIDNDVDLISIPLIFFEKRTDTHPLHFKYKSGKNEIIDLWTRYNCVQMHIGSSFIKKEALHSILFDPKLKYAEDAKVIMQILFSKCRYGIVPTAKYMYRIRNAGTSALDGSRLQKEWYIDYLKNYTHWAIQSALSHFQRIPKFVQYNIMYDMQYRFRVTEFPENVLNDFEKEEFLSLLTEAVKYVNDDIILAQKRIALETKEHILALKYGRENGIAEFFGEKGRFRFDDTVAPDYSEYPVKLTNFEFCDDSFKLEGCVKKNSYFDEPTEIYAKFLCDGNYMTIPCEFHKNSDRSYKFADTILSHLYCFKLQIPYEIIKSDCRLEIYITYGSHILRCKNQVPNSDFPVSSQNKICYQYNNVNYTARMGKKNFYIKPTPVPEPETTPETTPEVKPESKPKSKPESKTESKSKSKPKPSFKLKLHSKLFSHKKE